MKRRLSIGLVILLCTFGAHTSASANNVKIMLTAKIQESVEIPSAGITEYTAVTLRITQKDFLELLIYAGYTLPANPVLAYHLGSFQILDGNGTLVHTVSATHLEFDLSIGPSVNHGISNSNPGGPDKYKDIRQGTFELNADSANYFTLAALFDSNVSDNGLGSLTILRSVNFLGIGELGNATAVISGKAKYKLP